MISLTISRVKEIELTPIEKHEATGNYFVKLKVVDLEDREYIFHFVAFSEERLKIKGLNNKIKISQEESKKENFKIFQTFTSKLSSSRNGGKSLKTVIPRQVVDKLGLQQGDFVNWILRGNNGEILDAVIQKNPKGGDNGHKNSFRP